MPWRDVFASVNVVGLRNEEFDTSILGLPATLAFGLGDDFDVTMFYIHTRGQTREIAAGFAALSGEEGDAPLQRLSAHGFQAVANMRTGPVTFTLEFDLATGDADPRSENAITSYNFARDMNVGLLLFEEILAFESARSVAVGVENLANQALDSFPLTEVQTDGRFTNAIALFPQIEWDIVSAPTNELWVRAGVLMAWPEARGVVDPIATTLGFDGEEIADDAVNFHGGSPGSYYGTEVDVQLGWRYKRHFEWILEGAMLFPGSSLRDENGDAVISTLLENRFVFSF